MIKPTIGRVVWYQPPCPEGLPLRTQPFPALIAFVHSDTCINVGFFDQNGVPGSACSVKLLAEGEERPAGGYFAEWMPYQVGQAKKDGADAVRVSEPELVADILPAHVDKIMSQAASARFTRIFVGGDFGDALDAIKRGQRVARAGWNGKDMFVFLVPGSTFQVSRPPLLGIYLEGTTINYRPHIDIKGADGGISTWVPSIGDVMAEDWSVVE